MSSVLKDCAGYVFILLNTCYKFSPCDQEMLKYTTFSSDCIPQNFNYYALKIKYCKNRQALQAPFQPAQCLCDTDRHICRFKESGDTDKKKDISCSRNSIMGWEREITFLAVLILDFLFDST